MVEKKKTKSKKMFEKACEIIPGGVNSPVRAFKAVGGNPLFIEKGKGSKIYDVDGNEYIDYVMSWGPLILGHADADIVSALTECLKKGSSFGAPTELEIELASLVIEKFPSIEMLRCVNSGTEATMTAMRLARSYTGRDKILKFDGCYHGHADSLLVSAGSGVATLSIPGTPGIPKGFVENTLVAPYNNFERTADIIYKYSEKIAAVIIEPICGNIGCVLPEKGFLEGLRDITLKYDIVLIFDEVMTGFRVAPGGAQELYDIKPDLTCLGKIIGGGLPVGAFGGRAEIMKKLAPSGDTYQAGTLSGNPIAMTAGIKTLEKISKPEFYEDLDKKSKKLCSMLEDVAKKKGVKSYITRAGSMFTVFFTDKIVKDYDTAKTSDLKFFEKYFRGMLEEGIYLAPSQFEAAFISSAHTDEDIEKTVMAAEKVFDRIKG
jgi:glutamate-1-semialdehyde 2,1-aminomutase